MGNTGIHHISVMSSDIHEAFRFYHQVLGLKLTMKTVNQEDSRMYHLFFGDQKGRVGTEFTVFEMKKLAPYRFGTNALERTYFLVPSEESLDFWEKRLEEEEVLHYGIEIFGNRRILRFEDSDGQRLGFEYREGLDSSLFSPFITEEIPEEHAILGISSMDIRARYLEPTQRMLEKMFGFIKQEEIIAFGKKVVLFRFDNLFQHEIHVIVDNDERDQRIGVGSIHHIAFGIESLSDMDFITEMLDNRNVERSIVKNRDFMHSVYFKDATKNVIEVATPLQDKGIDIDQNKALDDIELFLPDFLESHRGRIENELKEQR